MLGEVIRTMDGMLALFTAPALIPMKSVTIA